MQGLHEYNRFKLILTAIGSFIRKENSARGVSLMNDCVFSSVLEELCCCIRGEAKDENLIKFDKVQISTV